MNSGVLDSERTSLTAKIGGRLFDLDSNIRYVALSQSEQIVEMEQNPKRPSLNPTETDRMEELIVNPAILELAKRRGNIDMHGVRYVIIRYGTMHQLIFPYKEGHLSIGIEPNANPIEIAHKVAKSLGISI